MKGAALGGRSMRVVLTGAGGFVGRHVARAFLERGHELVAICRPGGSEAPPGGGATVELDLASDRCASALESATRGADVVVHAAADVRFGGPESKIVQANVSMTRAVVRAAESCGARLVFLSSASALYERREQLGIREETALQGETASSGLCGYATSKRACEALVQAAATPWTILRPAAVIGPGDRTLMPRVLDAARQGRWAWIGERSSVRVDLVSVRNLAHWIVESALDEAGLGVLHLADGPPVVIEDVLRETFRRLEIDVPERRVPRALAAAFAWAFEGTMRVVRPGVEPEITRFGIEVFGRTRTLDTRHARAVLSPPLLTLAEGLDEMWASLGV